MSDTKQAERPSEGQPPEAAKPSKEGAQPAPKANNRRIFLFVGLGVLVLVGIIYGINFLLYSKDHIGTDDAYITGDLVNVSPLISGTLAELTVQQGDFVHRGQLIARIDPSGPIASYRQAQANYEAAASQIPSAQKSLEYERKAAQASVQKANAAVGAQQATVQGANDQVNLTSATVRNQIDQAKAQVVAANAEWKQATAQANSVAAAEANAQQAIQTAQDAAAGADQAVQTAQKADAAAQARVVQNQAVADRASKDVARFKELFDQGAISPQQYDSSVATAKSTQAQLAAAQDEAEEADSQVQSAQKAQAQAHSQVEQARKAANQAHASTVAANRAADASRQQVTVAQAGLGIAEANTGMVGVQRSNYSSNQQRLEENRADALTARADQDQVSVREEQVKISQAQANQARAALTNAKITFGDTYIYAPCDGEVVRKDSDAGATMTPGTTIITITRGTYVWVSANFKETQLDRMRVGQPAEVEVDAIAGKKFKGVVGSINSATGAATALLPPDNATGNFTKVVQRIPVRIELEAAKAGDNSGYATEDDFKLLRQGMSVTATVDVAEPPEQVPARPDVQSLLPTGGGSAGISPGGSQVPNTQAPNDNGSSNIGQEDGAPTVNGGATNPAAPNGLSNPSTAGGPPSLSGPQSQPNAPGGPMPGGAPTTPGPGSAPGQAPGSAPSGSPGGQSPAGRSPGGQSGPANGPAPGAAPAGGAPGQAPGGAAAGGGH